MESLSVIIPVKSGMPYLKWAVGSVLSSSFANLELVLSVDESSDGSLEFAEQLCDSRVKVVVPPVGLSMAEHWDFAQQNAKASWQMFLGQDDLLIDGYSSRVQAMLNAAEASQCDALVARRAYVNWEGLNARQPAIQCWGTETFQSIESESFIKKHLFTQISYHEGPQMYTSCIVNKRLLNAIRSENNGRLILGHPQDAFLAAAILKQSKKFLYFGTPFSLVGTSVRSAGFSITAKEEGNREWDDLRERYLHSILNSSLSGGKTDGFKHGSDALYFLRALEQLNPETSFLRTGHFGIDRLRFDINLLASGVASRTSREELRSLLTSKYPPSLLMLCSTLAEVTSKLRAFTLSVAAKLFSRVLRRRVQLIRVDGPLGNDSILAKLCDLGLARFDS